MRHTEAFRLFEWESVFEKSKASEVKESKILALASVSREKGSCEFARLKGALENIFESAGVRDAVFVSHTVPAAGDEWHRTQSADILIQGKKIGTIGTLMPFILKQLGITAGVAVAEIDTEFFRESVTTERRFEALPRFPFAVRDISLVFSGRQKSQAVVELMYEVGAPLIRSAELFDVFERDGKRNLAFHLSFGADGRTLTGREMDEAFDRIVREVKERFGGELHQ